jgi:predicted kinase
VTFLLQMAGLPGSGKSALAAAVGRCTGAVVIDKDVIMAGAMRAGVAREDSGAVAYEVGYDLASSILGAGHSVILDSPANFVRIREQGSAVASEAGASYYIIECVVTRELAEERIKGRRPTHALHPSTLDGLDVDFDRPGTAPLDEPRLVLDGSLSTEELLPHALEYIKHGQG